MNKHTLVFAAVLACAFGPALGAALDEDALPPPPPGMLPGPGGHPPGPGGFLFQARMHMKPVKNAPYSAEVVTERQQNLADGNQIDDKHSSMSYRDGAGRTRQELRDDKGELQLVTIEDPVANLTWILHPQDMSATRIERGPGPGPQARERIEQLRKEHKLPAMEHGAQEEVMVKRAEREDRAGPGRMREGVRIRIERNLAEGKQLETQLGPVLAGAFGDMKWAANATTKQLGSREFDGVKAEGKLRSYEIPAGAVGNRNPIVVSDETWYAPDLQVTVYAKHSDPRAGEAIVRLAGLRRGEPSPALFTVPSDYKVKEAPAGMPPPQPKPR
jgi:hypothetical protein